MGKTVKRRTEIFKDYKDFLKRKDRKLNGVTKEFAEKYPDYEKQNETNMGCFNCIGCTRCRTCVNCQFCDLCRCSCIDCVECYDCYSCKRCIRATSCKRCSDCNIIKNCTDCKKLTKCGNLVGKKLLKGIYSDLKAEITERRHPERIRGNMLKLSRAKRLERKQTYEDLFKQGIKEVLEERKTVKNRNKDISTLHIAHILKKNKYENFSEFEMKELINDIFSVMNLTFVQGGSVCINKFGTFKIKEYKMYNPKVKHSAYKKFVRFSMYWLQNKNLNPKYFAEMKKFEKGLIEEPTNEFEIKDPLDF